MKGQTMGIIGNISSNHSFQFIKAKVFTVLYTLKLDSVELVKVMLFL